MSDLQAMTDDEPVLGNDGLTDDERARHLAAFQTGIGSKSPEVPAAVALLTRAAAEEATLIERAAWTARVEQWATLLEGESPVGRFIAEEARTRLLVDDTTALDVVKAQAARDALTAAADALDHHPDDDSCEDGDHLTRLASSTWLRTRSTRI